MNALKKRPFAFACILFVICLFLLFYVGIWLKIALISIVLLSAFILLSNKSKHRFTLLYVIIPILLSCLLSVFHHSIVYRNILSYADKSYDCEYVITEEAKISESFSTYTIKLTKINGKKISFNAILAIRGKLDSPLFTSYRSKLTFSELKSYHKNDSPNYSYLSKNVYLGASLTDGTMSEQKIVKLFPTFYFYKLNSFLVDNSKIIKGDEERALTQALMLGNKEKLSENTVHDFHALGLSHMLAVSGLHLAIIIGSIGRLLEKTGTNKKRTYIFMIFITFVYAGMTGFSPSVKRAALMLVIFYLSFLISKNKDSITSLCSALALICFISPNSVFDVGLWLSFLSTYGILQVAVPIAKKLDQSAELSLSIIKKGFIKLWAMILFSIIPVIFSLPVIWLSYGDIAALSPISNIIFTPLLNAIMYVSPFTLLLSFIPILSNLLGAVSALCAYAMLSLADYCADFSVLIDITYSFVPYILIFLVISMLSLTLISTKNKYLYFLPFALSVLAFCVCVGVYKNNTVDRQKIIYTQTEEGESFLLISQNKAMLCDVSGCSYPNTAEATVLLKKYHISSLESYVVTDYNGKGIDTLNELISQTKIKKLYIPKALDYEDGILQKAFTDYAKANALDLTVYEAEGNSLIDFYGITIDVAKTADAPVNTPSSFCISFYNESVSYHYIGRNSYSTFQGYSLINDWFLNEENLIFGSYGASNVPDPLPLLPQSDKTIYFADSSLYSAYNKSISDDSTIIILNEKHVFDLN